MAYTKQTWVDGEAGGTPLSAARLNYLENGVDTAHDTADAAETPAGAQSKVDAGVADHNTDTTGVHGVAGAVVGTTDTQTLTNKTLTSPSISNPTVTSSETWHVVGAGGEPAFTNGYATTAEPPAFRKNTTGDTVFLRGIIDLGTDATSAFTLPAGYRPSAPVSFLVATDVTSGMVQISVNTNGTVVLYNKGAGTPGLALCTGSFSIL